MINQKMNALIRLSFEVALISSPIKE